jgi:nicotinamidase-related amidase
MLHISELLYNQHHFQLNLLFNSAMKKLTIILTILLLIIAGKSYSQEQKRQTKEQIKPALLIIDIQNAYLPYIPEREKEVALFNINAYIDLFRNHNCPVIRIYHYNKENGPKQDTEQFEFPTSVQIKSDDPKIIKTYPDGFNKTDLDKVIREKGCNTLFLCGLSAVGCVLATWIGAQNHDYKAFLIKDAIMSHNSDFTSNVEVMFDAVGYDVVNLILESAEK